MILPPPTFNYHFLIKIIICLLPYFSIYAIIFDLHPILSAIPLFIYVNVSCKNKMFVAFVNLFFFSCLVDYLLGYPLFASLAPKLFRCQIAFAMRRSSERSNSPNFRTTYQDSFCGYSTKDGFDNKTPSDFNEHKNSYNQDWKKQNQALKGDLGAFTSGAARSVTEDLFRGEKYPKKISSNAAKAGASSLFSSWFWEKK